MHMYSSPRAVFRLMMTNKGVRDAIRSAPEAWWLQLLGRVTAYQNGLRHSNYASHLRVLTRAHLLSHSAAQFVNGTQRQRQRCEGLLRCVFILRCCMCGARRGHRLLRPFPMRTCHACLRANVVSNATLSVRLTFVANCCVQGGLTGEEKSRCGTGCASAILSSNLQVHPKYLFIDTYNAAPIHLGFN